MARVLQFGCYIIVCVLLRQYLTLLNDIQSHFDHIKLKGIGKKVPHLGLFGMASQSPQTLRENVASIFLELPTDA